jgi:signal transduction histidine kinase
MLPLLSAVSGPAIRIEAECLSCPGHAQISPENLTRILMNLVRNAADAMKRGGNVRITVQQAGGASFQDAAFACSVSGPAALICVQDNGPGIAPQVIDRIFESGFSTRQTDLSWPRMPHRGFGLSIVRSLVESAGGRVCVVSLPNRGTRFEIELPLTNVTAVSPAEPRLLVEGGCR